MRRIALATALVAATAASGSGAAPGRPAGRPHTLLTTRSVIKHFAQDGSWVAWSTTNGCRLSLHLLSLRTDRRAVIRAGNDPIGCANYGGLALAGDRAIWTTLTGAGNTELDVTVSTADAAGRKTRRVRSMAMTRDEYGEEPLDPPIAGRGATLVYYRHEDGISGSVSHAVERIVGSHPKAIFRSENPV